MLWSHKELINIAVIVVVPRIAFAIRATDISYVNSVRFPDPK